MVAWMNREALAATLESGFATFYSRSRRALWRKGETSGHVLHVHEVSVDCDGDTLLVLVDPEGPSCHTGRATCFFRPLNVGGAAAASGPAGVEREPSRGHHLRSVSTLPGSRAGETVAEHRRAQLHALAARRWRAQDKRQNHRGGGRAQHRPRRRNRRARGERGRRRPVSRDGRAPSPRRRVAPCYRSFGQTGRPERARGESQPKELVPRAPSSCRVRRTPLRCEGRVEPGPMGHSALGASSTFGETRRGLRVSPTSLLRAPSSSRVRRTPLRCEGRVEPGPMGHSALGASSHISEKPGADFGFLLLVQIWRRRTRQDEDRLQSTGIQNTAN